MSSGLLRCDGAAAWPTSEMLRWSRDLQMFLWKILAAQNRHLFCLYLGPALEIWTGKQCQKGLFPLAGRPQAIRSAGRVWLWLVAFVYSADATPSFINNAVVPFSTYIVVSICSSDRADHLSSLRRLMTYPRFAWPRASESRRNLTRWLVKRVVEPQLRRAPSTLCPIHPHFTPEYFLPKGFGERGWVGGGGAQSSVVQHRCWGGQPDLRAGKPSRAPSTQIRGWNTLIRPCRAIDGAMEKAAVGCWM